jgi:two-component system sensor histidine kinase YesM
MQGHARMIMRKKIRQIKNSIFSRLILTFMFILIPLYILSVVIHSWGVSIIRTEIVSSMQSKISFHKLILDNEIARIDNLQDECLQDDDLLKLTYTSSILSDFEKIQSLNRLHKRLYTLKNSSIYIDDARLIIRDIGKTISANTGVSELSDQDQVFLDTFAKDQFAMLLKTGNTLVLQKRNYSVKNDVSEPHIIIQISYSNSALLNTFQTFDTYQGSGSILAYPDLDFQLATENNPAILTGIETLPLIGGAANQKINQTMAAGSAKFLVIGDKLDNLDLWLVSYVPEAEVFAPLKRYMYLLWGISVFSIIIIVFFSYSTHRFLQRPLRKLVEAFHRVEDGDIKFQIQHQANDEFKYLYTRFNAMLENINLLIEQVYAQKITSQRAELKQLQSQINPHFLYNNFFILQRMIQGYDNETAIQYCRYLGKYFQYVTRNAQDDMPLYKELEHAQNYLEIQSIRFPDLDIKIDELPVAYKDLLVPRLVFQPIIENIFEHGFKNTTNPRQIIIQFIEAEPGLTIVVEDSGETPSPEDLQAMNDRLSQPIDQHLTGESTGLINTNLRIRLKFGEACGITVSASELGGWKVTIRLSGK